MAGLAGATAFVKAKDNPEPKHQHGNEKEKGERQGNYDWQYYCSFIVIIFVVLILFSSTVVDIFLQEYFSFSDSFYGTILFM